MLPCWLCCLKISLESNLACFLDVMSMALPSQKAEGSYDLCTPGITDSLHVQTFFFCISLIACKCISVEHGIIINVRIDRCHSVCWILHKWRILVSWCKVTHCGGICFLYSSELSDEYFTRASFMHLLICICHVIAQHCAYISLQTYITGILVSCWNGIMEY